MSSRCCSTAHGIVNLSQLLLEGSNLAMHLMHVGLFFVLVILVHFGEVVDGCLVFGIFCT